MSHIFISYCHKDVDSLVLLLQALDENGLGGEVWYDNDIAAGRKWIPQIDIALSEAYALIVIVTPDSANSMYVTYEWSSALGSNTPVFPLLFKGNYTDAHIRLLQEQIVDCKEGIPSSLIDGLISHRSTPPEIDFLNEKISEITLRFRVATLITLWFFNHINDSHRNDAHFINLAERMLDLAVMLSKQELPELISTRMPAFSQKQLRKCRELINALHSYWAIFHQPTEEGRSSAYFYRFGPQVVASQAINFWQRDLKLRFEFFRTTHPYEETFDMLETHLMALDRGEILSHWEKIGKPFNVIKWAFNRDGDEEHKKMLLEAIERIEGSLRNANE